jgi:diguanylate cyclase (GGDEF)-like protein
LTGAAAEPLARPRLLLAGDAAARPDGLERALTRAGFHVSETLPAESEPPPDAVLITLSTADETRLAALLASPDAAPPRVVLFGSEDRDAPAAALALGAADALGGAVHVPELCARLHARIRERQAPSRTPYEVRVRESLRALVEESRTLLQPEEVALALVRRLTRGLGLASCSYVVTREGEDAGRVLADARNGRAEPCRIDLAEYPEIGEAIRSRRPLVMPDPTAATVVLPVVIEDAVPAVLLLRGAEGGAPLGPAQLELAGSLADAAARALEQGRARPGGVAGGAPALDRRLQEEFERARRYALGFSLVLLDVDSPAEDTLSPEEVERRRQEIGARLRRELRLPDFLSRCGGGGVAILLPETGAEGARRSVLRLRERLAADAGTAGDARLSAGIAAYPHPAANVPDDLFALVEAALERGRVQSGERIGVAD